jgi:hypothetical protein
VFDAADKRMIDREDLIKLGSEFQALKQWKSSREDLGQPGAS